MTPLSVCLNYVEYFDLYNLKTADRGVKFSSTKRYKIVSIKTFCRIVLVHAFQQTFQNDPFGRVGNILHGGDNFYAVVFQGLLMDRRFILVAGKPIELVNCHIFLWILLCVATWIFHIANINA